MHGKVMEVITSFTPSRSEIYDLRVTGQQSSAIASASRKQVMAVLSPHVVTALNLSLVVRMEDAVSVRSGSLIELSTTLSSLIDL